MIHLLLDGPLQAAAASPLDWYSIAGLVAGAGALLWLGALNNKVDTHNKAIETKVGREEFKLVTEKVDDVHEDVRHILRRLSGDYRGE